MKHNFKVNILLATYNGEKFLIPLLNSILKQTFKKWQLFVRDDGSTDNTKKILEDFQNSNTEKVVVINDGDLNLGACYNFFRLLEKADGDYIFFCDQDDVWLPEKIERMLNKMMLIEEEIGPNKPLLLHSDLVVVDANLKEISPSFWKYQFIDPEFCKTLPKLLLTNSVTGCATLINKALKQIILPVPEGVVMHDWWCALVAAAFGKIYSIEDSLVLYRQHGRNDVGAKAWTIGYIIKKALSFYDRNALQKGFLMTINQAKCFYKRYEKMLSPENKKIVQEYVRLEKEGFLEKRINIFKYGFFRTGLIRNIGFLLRI